MKLAPKIIILLLAVTFGVMTIYSIIQIKNVEKSLIKDAQENHTLMLSNSLGFLSKSLWELDKDISVRGMKPLFETGTVRDIILYDYSGMLFNGVFLKDKVKKEIEITDPENIKSVYNFDFAKIDAKKMPFTLIPSKLLYKVEKLTDNMYEIVGSLWWKETEFSEPRFLGFAVMHFSTEYISERLNEQIFGFLYLTIGLCISIIVLTYAYLEQQIISPIRKLMIASLSAASGVFTKIKTTKSKDEINKLTENFNYMIIKIENSLSLIRGLSEASQEIVKCKNIQEISDVYSGYCQKLISAKRVDVWVDTSNALSNSARGMRRLSDDKELEQNDPILKLILTTVEELHDRYDNLDNSKFINKVVIPLLNSKGIMLGLIEIEFTKSEFKYGEEENRVVKALGVPLATAIENYWHVLKEKERANIERDFELASAVQNSILSSDIPKSLHFDFSTYYKTASQCGGDWYGVYEVSPDKILVLFGDVTGHGTPAALITAVTRGAADIIKQNIALGNMEVNENLPALVLQFINECIFETGRSMYFMTMVAALIDFNSQQIIASSAGHTPPALISMNSDLPEVKYIYPKVGSRLGYEKGSKYETQSFSFLPGQQIVFYTDGIIEGENSAAKEYGMKKFKQSIQNHCTNNAEDFINNIINDAYSFFEGIPQKDDIAVLVIRFLTEKEKELKKDVQIIKLKAA
ncbi:SpoIIE family protein phosphatase [Fluviispira multicolorata]|uniref:SpoIIE family protein phosphatase n=1 Tax=Fluviispira multicolorata TaxID=2654512 RepID=A0A833JG74_9BACT|nr:SpoIIE family protein phosphatase [Fluviispira multicolorata]KAB8033710.1 SpoIIE family protein phosphatase [Fluviispira multicolorata]